MARLASTACPTTIPDNQLLSRTFCPLISPIEPTTTPFKPVPTKMCSMVVNASDQSDETGTAKEMAILFADIGGSTSLFQKAGDVEAHQLIANSLETMGNAVRQANGELLRTVGDAVLAKFKNCDDACAAAAIIQKDHLGNSLDVRVGFHWGSAIDHLGDVYGNAVNIAARVAGLANTREIITTEEVISRLTDLPAGPPQLLDQLSLKGVEKAVSIYRIPWEIDITSNQTQKHTMIARGRQTRVNIELDLSAKDQAVTLSTDSSTCTIGRSSKNSLQAIHDAASRVHATIEYKQGKYVLEDVSTNGTYVIKNGQPFVFIHRDSITLDGAGTIHTGFLPNDKADDEMSIRFVSRLTAG